MAYPVEAIASLSDFVVSARLDRLPKETATRAQTILLDTLGSILAASAPRYSAGSILLNYSRALGGTPECALIGSSERTNCVQAALYNATLGYYCDLDAHHPGAIMHAPAIVVPAALALAERQHRSGADLLTAIVLGVDVACRTSLALGPTVLYARGQHPTCVAGGFGAAAAAGHLLGLGAVAMRRAWGLTGTQASGLLAWETDDTETSRPFNPGIAARNGTAAALLASLDYGGPADIFEGKFNVLDAFGMPPHVEELTTDLGERFLIDELALKRYACCAFLHPALDGLAEILDENALRGEDIVKMRLRFPRSGVALIDNNPLRSHCAQYILPIYALERKIVIDDILLDRRAEPNIAALSEKVEVLADDELDREFPRRYTTIIEVDAGAATFNRRVSYAKGCPENPLSEEEVEAKFVALASSLLSADRIDGIHNIVRDIASADCVDPLIRLLQPAPQGTPR